MQSGKTYLCLVQPLNLLLASRGPFRVFTGAVSEASAASVPAAPAVKG